MKFHIKSNSFSLLVKIKNIKENSYFVLSGWKQILNSFWNFFILHTINKLTYLGFKNNFLVPISIKCGHIHHTFLKAFLRCVSQIFFYTSVISNCGEVSCLAIILYTVYSLQGKLWTYNHCYFTSIIRKFLYQWKERIWGRGQVAVRMDGFRTSPCTRIRDP